MTSDELKISKNIELMNKLEDFVLKKIKYPRGDERVNFQYYKSLGINISQDRLECPYEITEIDKQNIYNFHLQGGYKETEQQKKYRETAIQQIIASDDPKDTVEIPLAERLPRYYDDILNDIKKFYSYIESQQPVSLKQVEKLRKKAFYTYAMHNDCRSLETVPKEIYKIFEKIHNGYQQRSYIDIIKKGFLEYVENELSDTEKVNRITSYDKDCIIEKLEEGSLNSVKNAIIQQLETNISNLENLAYNLAITKDAALLPKGLTPFLHPTSQKPITFSDTVYIFSSNRDYFSKTIRKYKKRRSKYERDIKELKGFRQKSTKDTIRKKFTGDSKTWLSQHKVEGKSLYKRIEEIAANNKKKTYLKT